MISEDQKTGQNRQEKVKQKYPGLDERVILIYGSI